ncbi:hypothetical protein LCGC14_2002160 [marine sediment metagenome]|uniref:Uncharacterized protein n=1 Tax=marine sediment metagenome TaxID=412755 RepID=A0A0F9F2S2_9ZZZZ
MSMYLKYLLYVLRHKWFVFIECCRLGIPFRGIMHDLSKFRWREFRGYAVNFFTSKEWKGELNFKLFVEYRLGELIPWGLTPQEQFKLAWLHHQRRNPHHWEYWVYRKSDKIEFPVPIPKKYLQEMLADWRAMSRNFGNDPAVWYTENRDKMLIQAGSREWLEEQLGVTP